MVLVEVRAEGVAGIGWTYATAGCRDVILGVLAPVIVGADPMDVPGITEGMVRACSEPRTSRTRRHGGLGGRTSPFGISRPDSSIGR